MEEILMKEREISLIDLIVEILLKWRVIIVWMLVGGILMGGFSYVRSCRTAQAAALEEQLQQTVSEGQTELEYLESVLTNMQINNVNTAISYESLCEAKEAYLQESVMMQINPLEMPRALLTFQVVAEDVETAQRIDRVYEDMVEGGLSQWLADEVQEDVSDAAMSELISLESNSRELLDASDTFKISISHISEEKCIQLAEKVDEYFQEQHSQLIRKMGEHQIQLVNQNFSYVIDTELLDKLQGIQSNMTTWSVNAAKLKDAFSEEEWRYYNCLIANKQQGDSAEVQQSEEGEEAEPSSVTVIRPSVSMKYVLMGMVLFAFLYAFYVFLKYILSGRIRTADDVASLYGVPELGVIPAEKGGKRLFAFVDGWILKLRSWNRRSFATEEAIGLAAVAVKMAAKKEGLNEICCIGCSLKSNAVKTADIIQNILKEADISLKVLNNVLYDQEVMEQLLSARGAFLLERAGETLYDEVSREIELLHRQEIKVLGIIVVE